MSIEKIIAMYSDYHWESEIRMMNRLADGVTSGVIVSIGSYRGQSDCALALHAHVPLYAIDPRVVPGTHYGDVDRPFWMNNVLEMGLAEKIRPVNLASTEAAKTWSQPIGLLFIDGAHDYQSVHDDLAHWMPFVLDNGIVIMHDSSAEGVILAVSERDDLVEFERANLSRCYRKEPLYEPYTYDGQTLMVRKGIGFADDKTTPGEVRTYDVGSEEVTTCIDVGANIGAFSAWIKSLWPSAEIVAIEPELSSYHCLLQNVGDIQDALAVRGAVRYSHEEALLYVNPNNSGCHRVLLASEVTDGLEVTPITSTFALETVMAQRDWATLDLLKIDAEGSEVDILMNCTEDFLRKTRRIVGERHQPYEGFMETIGARLESLGFTVAGTQDPLAHATFVAINQNWVFEEIHQVEVEEDVTLPLPPKTKRKPTKKR